MKLNFNPEEFIVEEISSDGTVLEIDKKIEKLEGIPIGEKNDFSWFVMQKRGWTTQQALEALARKIGVSKQRFNSAGTKDRNAITTQLCSAFGIAPERMLNAHVKDVKINGAWPASEKIRIGNLAGNRFTIIANEQNFGKKIDFEKINWRIQNHDEEILNLFGAQRFGSLRANTHLVGYEMLVGNYEAAAKNYLCFCGNVENTTETRKEEIEARKKLEEDFDFSKALEYFPHWLKFERGMLSYLAKNPHDFVGAIRSLPRSISLFFIHAAQSDIFNEALLQRAKEGKQKTPFVGEGFAYYDTNGFPKEESAIAVEEKTIEKIEKMMEEKKGTILGTIAGYETEPADEYSKAAMEKRGITSASFLLKSMPELSSKGGYRSLFVRAVDLAAEKTEAGIKTGFSLPSGAYATIAIEQLLS